MNLNRSFIDKKEKKSVVTVDENKGHKFCEKWGIAQFTELPVFFWNPYFY